MEKHVFLSDIRPMAWWVPLCLSALFVTTSFAQPAMPTRAPTLAVDKIAVWMDFSAGPDIPLPHGVSGAYVGVSGDALILAGGDCFPVPLESGGKKQYTSHILTLRMIDAAPLWESSGELPFPVAHGAAVSTPDGIICLGGENESGALDTVVRLAWDQSGGRIHLDTDLPQLPRPLTYIAATCLGNNIYVAGGKGPDGQESADFWTLNLHALADGWQRLPTWPGTPRFGAALAAQYIENTGYLYLFGGKSGAHYLQDTLRYNPVTARWSSAAPLPRPAMLAPSLATGQSSILLFSGADGYQESRWRELGSNYMFPSNVLAYHTITDTWTQHGVLPTGVAGTSAVRWQGGIVIPGGELRPGVRTSKIQIARLRSVASRFGWLDQCVLYLYLAALAGMCVWLYVRHRYEETADGFFLGGRNLPGWAAGMSLMATAVSSIGFMAIPAKTFATDWTYFAGVFTWFLVVPIIVVAFIPFFRRIRVATAYELLEDRFDVKVRTFAAIGFSLMEGGRMAIVLLLPATALATVTPLGVEQTVVLMGLFSMLYAVMAGMRGVVWTDVIQGLVMISGAILCVVIAVFRVGDGFGELLSVATNDGKFAFNLAWNPAAAGVWVVVVGNIFIRLAGFTSSQSSVQRLLSTPDERQAAKALWTDVLFSVPWAIIVFFLGTALYVFYKRFPAALPPDASDIEILPIFMSQQLPSGLSGLMIAAIFAAGMSSLDTSMHSLATTWSRDFYSRFCPSTSERAQVIFSKIMIIVFGIVATGSALVIQRAGVRGMWDFFISLFGLFGGVLCGIFMLARFSRRANAAGTLLGGIASFVVMVFIWRYHLVHGLLYTALGVVLCTAFGWIFSLLMSLLHPARRSILPAASSETKV